MSNRRKFITSTVAGIAGLSLLPAVNIFGADRLNYQQPGPAVRPKLRFALISDLHYGQPGTDYDTNAANMVKWLNAEHAANHLDLIIFNGDLVHDQVSLLKVLKTKYLDFFSVPYFTLPGNHDHADSAVWKDAFGYADNYSMERGDIGFVLANTADTRGEQVCPDLLFLKASLDKYVDKQLVFVVLHIPVVQWLEAEKKFFLYCPETVDLLHKYPNVKAVFHGHDHFLDGVRYTGKLPHFFDAHLGGNWGTDYRGYRIVEVSSTNEVTTYQVNASMNPRLNTNKI